MNRSAEASRRTTKYVLLTSAYNEERCIEGTILSVMAQEVLPVKWVIVSDGSTDRTDEVAKHFAEEVQFIEFLRRESDHNQGFASKVFALKAGGQLLEGEEFDYIGHLDADISIEPTYFERLLEKFEHDPKLGLAGGYVCEEQEGNFRPRSANSTRSVAGAVQMFRRECYEAIGGLLPIKYGGEDWHAEVRSRMAGWHVQSFPDLKVFHHRPTGAAEGRLRSWYRMGFMDYSLGSHPLFEIVRLARRVRSRPYVVAAFVRFCAFAWANCGREKRPVSEEFVKYIRREELARLWPFGRSGLRG